MNNFSVAALLCFLSWSQVDTFKDSGKMCPKVRCGGFCKAVKNSIGCDTCDCDPACLQPHCSPHCRIDYSGAVSMCPACECIEDEVTSTEQSDLDDDADMGTTWKVITKDYHPTIAKNRMKKRVRRRKHNNATGRNPMSRDDDDDTGVSRSPDTEPPSTSTSWKQHRSLHILQDNGRERSSSEEEIRETDLIMSPQTPDSTSPINRRHSQEEVNKTMTANEDCKLLKCGGMCKNFLGFDGCPTCICSPLCPDPDCPPRCRIDYSAAVNPCPICICEGKDRVRNRNGSRCRGSHDRAECLRLARLKDSSYMLPNAAEGEREATSLPLTSDPPFSHVDISAMDSPSNYEVDTPDEKDFPNGTEVQHHHAASKLKETKNDQQLATTKQGDKCDPVPCSSRCKLVASEVGQCPKCICPRKEQECPPLHCVPGCRLLIHADERCPRCRCKKRRSCPRLNCGKYSKIIAKKRSCPVCVCDPMCCLLTCISDLPLNCNGIAKICPCCDVNNALENNIGVL